MRDPLELASLLAAGILPNLAYLALGLWLLRPLGVGARGAERPRGAERLALAFVFGTGAASLLLLGLRSADVPIPLWSLAVVAAAGIPRWRDGAADPEPSDTPGWQRAVDGASVGVAAFGFLAALAPETWWDGFEYHLPIARAFGEGPIRALPGMLDAELRAGIDLLYVPAVAAGQPDAAACVSACFAAALAALIRAEATRRASAGAGALAGLLTLLVPFTLDNAASSYTDLGVAVYGFCGLLYAERFCRSAAPTALTASALCLAFAANAKLHAGILAAAALVLLLAGGRRPRPLQLAGFACILAVGTAPWFLKVGLTTGNPLFPLFCDWLGYGPTSADLLAAKRGDVYYYVHVERSLAGFASYVASLTFGRSYHIGGLLGPLPLALAPLALARPTRPTSVLLALILVLFGLQFWFMPALRFGSPLLPWLALATALGGARLARSSALSAGVLGVTLTALGLLHGASMLATFGPRVAALRDPEAYERTVFPDQVALRELVARAEPVVAIPRGAVAWMPKPVYNLHWSRNGELFFDDRTRADTARALLERRGVRSIAFDVEPRELERGRSGHPLLDAWLDDGSARLRVDPDPAPARRGRVWVLVELR